MEDQQKDEYAPPLLQHRWEEGRQRDYDEEVSLVDEIELQYKLSVSSPVRSDWTHQGGQFSTGSSLPVVGDDDPSNLEDKEEDPEAHQDDGKSVDSTPQGSFLAASVLFRGNHVGSFPDASFAL